MLRRFLALTGLLAVIFLAAPDVRAALATSDDLRSVCEEFYRLDLDPDRAHDVTNAVIARDVGMIRLTKGVLIFSQALEGVTPIAVFIGEGSFQITPIRKMDRHMLDIAAEEHLNRDVGGMINTKVSQALILSYEKIFEDIKPFMSAPRSAAPEELEEARKVLRDRLAVLDTVQANPEFGLIAKVLASPSPGAPATAVAVSGEAGMRAEMNTADFGWLAFRWTPGTTYEVALWAREPIGAFYMDHPLIVTHRRSDIDATGRYAADPEADLHEYIKVKHYRMDLEIPDLQQINIDVDVTFTPVEDDVRLVDFDLINDLFGPRWNDRRKWVDVLSVKDAAGSDLPFVHRKNAILVLLKEPAPKGQDVTLNFKLNENTVIQLSNVHWLMLNTYPWFPQHGYLGGQYALDWSIKTVKPLTATGSGKTVKTWEEEKLNGVQMTFERPVTFPSIIFGRYQAETGEYDSALTGAKILLAAHSWPLTIFKFTDPVICSLLNLRCPLDMEVTVPPAKPRDVVEEGKTIIKFYEDLYGPFPYEKMDVAMMAPRMGFGQAPPAFVQLTGEAFQSSAALTSDFFHEFYSHEIAHQWWVHKIGFIADEDEWLSEAFAEYSAGLYVMSLMGKKRFDDKMRQWRKAAEIADPHGAIAWANNLTGQQAGLYREGLLYNKGPYVVHMLRMTMGLDNFKKAMQSVFTKYGYSKITTDMLKRECEIVMGYGLDFFFDQWFRDTGIPTFDYSWSSEPTPDGKHLVSVNISQRDKERVKQVLMPVYFYFKGQKEPIVRPRPILKAEDVYQIKLPKKPVRVVLDEDNDLLATMIPSGAGAGQ